MPGLGDVPREPWTRAEIDSATGPMVVEFGASWCGYCRALAPKLANVLGQFADVQHIKVEDGPGLPLGRSFRVTLWPTLVFLKDGQVAKQVARPEIAEIREGLEAITGPTATP